MTNQTIDNSADGEFGKVILWQYDKAENIVAFVKSFLGVHDTLTKDLWDRLQKELNVDTASDFGLALLGMMIGMPRMKQYGKNAVFSTERYRSIIKAYAKLTGTNYSIKDMNDFLKSVFLYAEDGGDPNYAFVYDCTNENIPSKYRPDPMELSYGFLYANTPYRQSDDSDEISRLKTIQKRLTESGISPELAELVGEYFGFLNYKDLGTHPCAVLEGGIYDYPIFGFDGQQAKTSDDYVVGGFDDSTFIPQEYLEA